MRELKHQKPIVHHSYFLSFSFLSNVFGDADTLLCWHFLNLVLTLRCYFNSHFCYLYLSVSLHFQCIVGIGGESGSRDQCWSDCLSGFGWARPHRDGAHSQCLTTPRGPGSGKCTWQNPSYKWLRIPLMNKKSILVVIFFLYALF